MNVQPLPTLVWRRDPSVRSATRAERAVVGRGRTTPAWALVAFDFPPADRHPRRIGWELHSGEDLFDVRLVVGGEAETFEAAKIAVTLAWKARLRPTPLRDLGETAA